MSQFDHYAAPGHPSRNAVIAAGVVLFHVAALWALQSGLARKAVAIIIPAEVIAQIMAPPAPEVQPPPAAPPPPVLRPAMVKKATPRLAPVPLTVADPAPAPPNAPLVAAPDPTPPAPASPAAPATAPVAAPAAPPRMELPSSNAAYLNNPAPSYPSVSRRMGEQGKVVLRVLISAEGLPEKIEIQQSSGYDRLDRHAQDTVQRWRFVPGKRNGVAEAMWNLVPINFVLE